MTTATFQKETDRTPSMFASLLVLGVMVALILLSVGFFGGEVAEGPLQVSMTLATLFALGVAYYYGFRGSLISHAISSSLSGVMGTIFVILAIGTVIGTLYLTGTVANIIYYGVAIISAKFYYITIFIIALALSMMLGSSLTTVGAVGVAFVGLASIMGVNPAIAAGAAVAGAIMGNKTAKISDTVNLTVATVGGVTVAEQTRVVMRTAIPTILISALIFLVLGLTGGGSAAGVDPAQVQSAITEHFNISLWAFIPVLLIFALSALRFSAYMALMIPAIVAVVLAGFTQHDLIVSLAADPSLSYFQAFFKVSIDVLAHGFHLNSGVEQLDKLFAGGGATGMLTTIWLLAGGGQLWRGGRLHGNASARHDAGDQLGQGAGQTDPGDDADLDGSEYRDGRSLCEHRPLGTYVPAAVHQGTSQAGGSVRRAWRTRATFSRTSFPGMCMGRSLPPRWGWARRSGRRLPSPRI